MEKKNSNKFSSHVYEHSFSSSSSCFENDTVKENASEENFSQESDN